MGIKRGQTDTSVHTASQGLFGAGTGGVSGAGGRPACCIFLGQGGDG